MTTMANQQVQMIRANVECVLKRQLNTGKHVAKQVSLSKIEEGLISF